MGLLSVPGTPAGLAENADNFNQVLNPIKILILKIYHISSPSARHFSKKFT